MYRVHSCQYSTPDRVHKEEVMASHFVLNIIDSMRHLNKLKMSPESVSFETFRKWGKCKGKTAEFFHSPVLRCSCGTYTS